MRPLLHCVWLGLFVPGRGALVDCACAWCAPLALALALPCAPLLGGGRLLAPLPRGVRLLVVGQVLLQATLRTYKQGRATACRSDVVLGRAQVLAQECGLWVRAWLRGPPATWREPANCCSWTCMAQRQHADGTSEHGVWLECLWQGPRLLTSMGS